MRATARTLTPAARLAAAASPATVASDPIPIAPGDIAVLDLVIVRVNDDSVTVYGPQFIEIDIPLPAFLHGLQGVYSKPGA